MYIYISLYSQIKGLEDYLKDPVRRNIIISNLPAQMRQQLLHERKYIHVCHEVCSYLCQMGLLTFGKREYKVKEQVGWLLGCHDDCHGNKL